MIFKNYQNALRWKRFFSRFGLWVAVTNVRGGWKLDFRGLLRSEPKRGVSNAASKSNLQGNNNG